MKIIYKARVSLDNDSWLYTFVFMEHWKCIMIFLKILFDLKKDDNDKLKWTSINIGLHTLSSAFYHRRRTFPHVNMISILFSLEYYLASVFLILFYSVA